MEEVNEEVVEVANDTTENQAIDYKAEFEKADKEAKRLNSLIQKHKKAPKADASSETQTFWKEDMQKMLDDRDFYSANPNMTEHKEAIDKHTSNGLSNKDAMTLVMANDSTIQARQNTNNSNFTDWVSWGGSKSYSQEDLYNLGQKNPALKRQAMEEIASGKATETI
jgi:hypothetical protein